MKKLVLAFAIWLAAVGLAAAAVNINTASKDELVSVKGIGEKRAQAIIDYRTKNGPFKTVDDLEKVPGIGPGLMKQIKPHVSVSGQTTTDKTPTSNTSKTAADNKTSKPAESAKTSTNTKAADTAKAKSDPKASNTTAPKKGAE